MFVTYIDLLRRCELRLVICVDKVPFGLLIGANRLFAALLGRETECVVVHESLIQADGGSADSNYIVYKSLSHPLGANRFWLHQQRQTKQNIKSNSSSRSISPALLFQTLAVGVYIIKGESKKEIKSRVGIILEIVKVAEATAVCRHCLKTRQTHRGLQICACLRLQPGNLCRQFG